MCHGIIQPHSHSGPTLSSNSTHRVLLLQGPPRAPPPPAGPGWPGVHGPQQWLSLCGVLGACRGPPSGVGPCRRRSHPQHRPWASGTRRPADRASPSSASPWGWLWVPSRPEGPAAGLGRTSKARTAWNPALGRGRRGCTCHDRFHFFIDPPSFADPPQSCRPWTRRGTGVGHKDAQSDGNGHREPTETGRSQGPRGGAPRKLALATEARGTSRRRRAGAETRRRGKQVTHRSSDPRTARTPLE